MVWSNIFLALLAKSDIVSFEFKYKVSNKSYSVEFQLFYPSGTDIDLHVYNENGEHVGFNPFTGKEEIGFPAEYSGKYERPEIIYIPKATNNTYTIKAKLVKENTNLSIPIKISALEEPFRPTLLALSPAFVNKTLFTNEEFVLDFYISEIGKQKPLENVSVELKLEGIKNYTSKEFYFNKIDAGSSKSVNFILKTPVCGNFKGKLKVNSSAGFLSSNISLKILTKADINKDGKVNIFDLAILGKCWKKSLTEKPECMEADLNEDGKVNIFDLAILGKNWKKEC